MQKKLGLKKKVCFFSATIVKCVNETGQANRRHIGLVCCIMFAHLTKVKGHQGP